MKVKSFSVRKKKLHEIDGEIRLEGETGDVININWNEKPVRFCVGFNGERWNQTEPETILEVTQWPIMG